MKFALRRFGYVGTCTRVCIIENKHQPASQRFTVRVEHAEKPEMVGATMGGLSANQAWAIARGAALGLQGASASLGVDWTDEDRWKEA